MDQFKGFSEDHTLGCRKQFVQTRGLNGRIISTDGACVGGSQIRSMRTPDPLRIVHVVGANFETLLRIPHSKTYSRVTSFRGSWFYSDRLVHQLGPEERKKAGRLRAEEWFTNNTSMIDTY